MAGPAAVHARAEGAGGEAFLTSRDRSVLVSDRMTEAPTGGWLTVVMVGLVVKVMAGSDAAGARCAAGGRPVRARLAALADGDAASFARVVGGDVADGLVKPDGVVVGPGPFELGGEDGGGANGAEGRERRQSPCRTSRWSS
jgi:hypothetical protein